MKSAEQIMEELRRPFAPEDLEWRVGSTNGDKTKGLALAYVTNRAIMNRLDETVGTFNWKNEFREWKGNSQLCGISIRFEKEWITKWDGSDDSNYEATKGGLSDAMKRAGYQWGIGRYLYNLTPKWVPIKQVGKMSIIENHNIPKLPAWALPSQDLTE
ncbi:Rad52/22 double-strand break repair protein [Paenibacillus phage SV21]|nr:Rad52/22 double-strand break repair protein [Paenibacillus phage SV21]